MSETRKNYIIRVYGCNELSWEHWDAQDLLHNGHIPGTATELIIKDDTQNISQNKNVTRETIAVKRGRPKKKGE